MKKSELKQMIREEVKAALSEAPVKLECQECGKKFSKSNPTSNTKCPKCGGYDIDVAY